MTSMIKRLSAESYKFHTSRCFGIIAVNSEFDEEVSHRGIVFPYNRLINIDLFEDSNEETIIIRFDSGILQISGNNLHEILTGIYDHRLMIIRAMTKREKEDSLNSDKPFISLVIGECADETDSSNVETLNI